MFNVSNDGEAVNRKTISNVPGDTAGGKDAPAGRVDEQDPPARIDVLGIEQRIRRASDYIGYERYDPRAEMWVPVSKFVLSIQRTRLEAGGKVREVKIISEKGASRTFLLAKVPFRKADFRDFITQVESFTFHGTEETINDIWAMEFEKANDKEQVLCDRIGLIREKNLWLWGNGAILSDGTLVRADDEDVVWLPGQREGYVASSGREGNDIRAKDLAFLSFDPPRVPVHEMISTVEKGWGGGQMALAVGWAIAALHLNEIRDAYGCFPILYIGGKAGAGKTHFTKAILGLHGLTQKNITPLPGTSKAGIERNCRFYSSVAYVLDEYRNSDPKETERLNGILRSIFDGRSGAKGTTGRKTLEHTQNAALVISGEDITQDSATMSRFVTIAVSAQNRSPDAQAAYHEAMNLLSAHQLSHVAQYVLRLKSERLVRAFELTNDFVRVLKAKGAGSRVATNYGIAAGFYVAYVVEGCPNDAERVKELKDVVLSAALGLEQQKNDAQQLSEFFEEMLSLKQSLGSAFRVYRNAEDVKDTSALSKRYPCIALSFPEVYKQVAESRKKRGLNTFSQLTLRSQLAAESYCLTFPGKSGKRTSSLDVRLGHEAPRSCTVLSLCAEHNPPKNLLHFAGFEEAVGPDRPYVPLDDHMPF